jgi:hypothetical protein
MFQKRYIGSGMLGLVICQALVTLDLAARLDLVVCQASDMLDLVMARPRRWLDKTPSIL